MSRVYKYIEKIQVEKFTAPYIVLDLETTGLNPRKDQIVGIAFALADEGIGYYTTDITGLMKAINQSDCQVVMHNAVFDCSFLKQKQLFNPATKVIHDTMLLAHMVDPDRNSLGLKDLAVELLGPEADIKDRAMKAWLSENNLDKGNLHKAPLKILVPYACEDAINTFALFVNLCKKLGKIREYFKVSRIEGDPWKYYQQECCALIPVVVDMQLRGVKLDLEATALKQTELAERMSVLAAELTEANKERVHLTEELLTARKVSERQRKNKTGKIKKAPPRVCFNWDSNDHLKVLFFDLLKLKVTKKTAKGFPSVDESVLETHKLQFPWVEKLLEYKILKKLTSTYLNGLLSKQEGGYIHAHFNMAGTTTGRFSSSGPNLQNLPKHGGIKKLFVPRQGYKFIYADYSQLELRIAAHLSHEPILCHAYQNDRDIHRETAAVIFGKGASAITLDERDQGKTVNFAIIYKASGWRVAEILGYMDGLPLCVNEAEGYKCKCVGCTKRKAAAKKGDAIVQTLFGKYKILREYIDRQQEFMLHYKVSVSQFGKFRRLNGIDSETRSEFNHALKAGFNLPIQSFGASLCKRSMVQLWRQGFSICNQVHDSLLVEVPEHQTKESMARIKTCMEGIAKLSVPLVVEPKVLDSFEEKV